MPYFTKDRTTFHYYQKGEGLPLCFLHGLGGSLEQAIHLLGSLPGLQLLSLDFRGHGQTAFEGDPSAYQIPVFADDVLVLLDLLAIERVVLGGLSLGAAVSLNFAVRHPERVSGLILLRPAWLNHPFPVNLDQLVCIGRWIEMHGLRKARSLLLEDARFKEVRQRSAGAAESLLGQLDRPLAARSYEALKRLPGSVPFHGWEELEAMDLPVLVIENDRDPLHPRNVGRQLAAGIPGAEVHRVTPRYVKPKQHDREVRELIAEFVRKSFY